jgi:hypothetical protein
MEISHLLKSAFAKAFVIARHGNDLDGVISR